MVGIIATHSVKTSVVTVRRKLRADAEYSSALIPFDGHNSTSGASMARMQSASVGTH
jgi:hypothetical protein